MKNQECNCGTFGDHLDYCNIFKHTQKRQECKYAHIVNRDTRGGICNGCGKQLGTIPVKEESDWEKEVLEK